MSPYSAKLTTGIPGLDRVFQGLRPGDNVVWQVDSIEDYVPFVKPYCRQAMAQGRRLIYFRFAKHEPLVDPDLSAETYELDPAEGFESFITRIHDVISQSGQEAFYVFDALSELTLGLYSDRMLANFYVLTCPYLYALHTVAYYALLKNYHSFYAASPIAETTQILVDVYRHDGRLYIHPRKVAHRYSQTMHTLHVWDGDEFHPVRESNIVAEVLASTEWAGLNPSLDRPGVWARSFLQARETLDEYREGRASEAKVRDTFERSVRMAVTQDERALALAEKHLTLSDVLDVKKRMVSSGLIGGKAAGMLLARAMLRNADPKWSDILEPHDSFFIGSEVFYSFLVRNHCWRLRQKQKDPATFLDSADEARQRILMGEFPEHMKERFANMLDYFGQAPIIVRSSSLLEDNYGNAFAGKYESVFCANQGPRHIRLEDFMNAVRRIYASSMSEEALTYRAERGVLDKDEQMALLVQRVSGVQYGTLFFPQMAGVAFSFNPYGWNEAIDPKAGMLRLVFGLGTRAVDRSDDDYTRVVSLGAPHLRPETNFNEMRRYAQRRVDVLDLQINQLVPYDFVDVVKRCPGLPVHLFATRDAELESVAETRGQEGIFSWVPTFDNLLSQTRFAEDMREMMQILEEGYGVPVDVEFTLNFLQDGRYKINVVQCRPLQGLTLEGAAPARPEAIDPADILLEARGAVIGRGRHVGIDRFIYVVPEAYGALGMTERHEISKLIGRLCHHASSRDKRIMLLGPGRWGTSTPALGVPVAFRDIRPVTALCEIVAMREDLTPDVSLGTHFFSDLIETDILYIAVFPGTEGNRLNRAFFESSPNRLADVLPKAARWADTVRILDLPPDRIRVYADPVEQQVLCFKNGPSR